MSKTSIKHSDSLFELIDVVPDPVIIINAQAEIVAANGLIEQYLGYKNQELIGKHIEEVFLNPKNMFSPDESTPGRPNGFNFDGQELKVKLADGSFKFVEAKAKRIPIDGAIFGFLICHDITERKKTEQELWQARNDWELTFNSVPDLIAILDNNHRIVRVNHAMAETLGAVPEKCVGLHCYSCVHGASCAPDFCPHAKTLSDGKEHIEEVHEEHLGGDFLVSTSPLVDKAGKVTGSVHVARNITERKRAERKVEEYARQLEAAQARLVNSERLAAIGELARQVGHDLRNPLASMKNAAFYLKKKGKYCTDEDREKMLNIIDHDIIRSDRIINALLEYSSDIFLETEETSPKSLVSAALAEIPVPKRIEVITYATDEPKMLVDVCKIKKVFAAIIENAIEAMPNGGLLKIDASQDASNVVVAFTDSGVGISEDILPKIFSPLFTTKAQGMGLSLATCKRIINLHGGHLEAKSALNMGSTFTVILPIQTKSTIVDSRVFEAKDPLLHYQC